MPLQPEDVELPQAPPVFPSLESLSNIQKQDITPTTSFPVPGDTTIPPVTPEVPQQFLRDPQENLPPETSSNSGGVVVLAMSQMAPPSQPQPQQTHPWTGEVGKEHFHTSAPRPFLVHKAALYLEHKAVVL